jgi:FG-GAP-like repeat
MIDFAAVGKPRPILSLLSALALCGATLVGCATDAKWRNTREEVINPIHRLLHHRYPESFQSGDPDRIADTFSPDALPDQLAPSLELLATFSKVEYGSGFIDRVDLEAQPVRGWIRLKLEGIGLEGERRVVRQQKEFELVHEGRAWRIARDVPTPFVVVPQPAAHFFDETLTRALWFRHEGKDKIDPKGVPHRYVYGSGIAAADLDGDGWDDLVLASGGRVDVFRNERGVFHQVSEDWGVGDELPVGDRILSVVIAADFDNDGFQDLFVGAEFGQPLLLRGDGRRFTVVPDSGLHTAERTISASVADFDGDGFLDLYLANHEDEYRRAPDPPWSHNAEPDQLFLNEGDGTFRDATRRAGLGNRGWALTPVAADYDGDGDEDLFVGNDFGTSMLYRNDGHGDFDEVAADAGVDAPVAAMGADWGDYDGDGDLDLFVGGMSSNAGWVLEAPDFQIRRVPGFVDWMFRSRVRKYVRAWFRGNRFYENQGDGTFVERAHEMGVDAHGWSWATVWLDFDNDGYLDVYALNGFITGPLKDDL